MEPRGCVADFDRGTARYTLYTSTQAVHVVRQTLARQILHVPENRIRVIARDVGGGFGMKGQTYPEEAVLTHAARLIGRPVKWIPSRTEALLGDNHARDQTVDANSRWMLTGAFWRCAGTARITPVHMLRLLGPFRHFTRCCWPRERMIFPLSR